MASGLNSRTPSIGPIVAANILANELAFAIPFEREFSRLYLWSVYIRRSRQR